MTDAATAITVRAATAEPVAAITDIDNEGIRGRTATFEARERTPDEVREWLGESRHPVVVAEADGGVVGWVAASTYRPRECYAGIAEFGPERPRPPRGRRAARRVPSRVRGGRAVEGALAQLLPACEAAGLWKVLSRIFPENQVSRRLCAGHGFREVGTYAGHARLDGAWRDVVIVERLLGKGVDPASVSSPKQPALRRQSACKRTCMQS